MIYLTQYVMEEKMMKATGIVRRIDDLGRIVIPKEIRRTLHIRESDPLEIFTDREGQVILKKYSPYRRDDHICQTVCGEPGTGVGTCHTDRGQRAVHRRLRRL